MMGKCGSVYCARSTPSAPDDLRTGQDLRPIKDAQTYEGFGRMKGEEP